MKNLKTIFFTAIVVIGVIFIGYSLRTSNTGGVVQNAPTYSTASSTVYSLGNQLSTKVLDSYSRRAYARICNNTGNTTSQDIFLVFGSTAITATTSADQVIQADQCYEMDRDNLYIGELQILTGTGTTTAVYVTELRD